MLGKKLRTEDDRIKAAAKARKKKRKKMIKTKYGQKAVRHLLVRNMAPASLQMAQILVVF